MPSVRGCNLPDELLYDVDNHIWFTEMGDGTVKLGMTTVATAMAGKLVAYTPKKSRTQCSSRQILRDARIRQMGRTCQVGSRW